MPNRTLAFAYVACAVFAAVIAFLLATTAERTIYVLEDSQLVWISQSDGTHDNDEVAASVQQVADDQDASIGYVITDVNEPSSVVHLYLAVANSEPRHQQWLEDGYPAFGRDLTVTTHPITDFGEVGPNGIYLIFGDAEAEAALRAALSEHGLHEAAGTQVTQMWHYFTGGHLFNLLAVALLGSATATGAGVLLSARDHGVMRLQGRSYLDNLGGDLRKVLLLSAIALPSVAAATLTFLGAYNGWNQIGLYSLLAVVFLALLAVPCLLVHAAVLGLVHTTGILPALMREADAAGDMVLTIHGNIDEFLPVDQAQPWTTPSTVRPVLVVNDTYLAEEEVLSPSGERHGSGDTVRIIVPDNARELTDELVAGVANGRLTINGRGEQAPEVEALVAADGQTLFTYAAKGMSDPQHFLPLVHDPVVIALPNGAILSDNDYVNHLTGRSTAFPDPSVVEDFREESPEASRYLSMVETLTVSALKDHHYSLNVLRSETFNLLGAGAVLLVTAMAACIVHVRTRAQEIFARHISGWTFAATHRRLLLVEGGLAVAFLGWATWDTLRKPAMASDAVYGGPAGMGPSGAEPFYALGIVLVSMVITITALALFHRKIVREGASQA